MTRCSDLIECHKLEWEIKKRTDAAWVQATTLLVASFCRQLDNVLSCGDEQSAVLILSQWFEIGYLAAFESLLSTSGQESGMLGDADAAISKLEEIELYVIAEYEEERERAGSDDEEEEEEEEELESKRRHNHSDKGESECFGRVAMAWLQADCRIAVFERKQTRHQEISSAIRDVDKRLGRL